ncbi:MAG: hypothetical protein GYA51_17875 [Candidatus Methanofastidiosa archaeon]|nr:hypothetical protein [Candidatus Methanofastidiosa archaeon]
MILGFKSKASPSEREKPKTVPEMLHITDNGNIIVHQIIYGDTLSIQEVKPQIEDSSTNKFLSLSKDRNLKWVSIPYNQFQGSERISVVNDDGIIKIDASIDTRLIIDDRLKGTNIYYSDGRVGVGRGPLYTYKFDIAVPENTLMTAFHVGDGTYGFSMGNGTNQGFIPEIIGMGSNENDPGLYLIGRAGNNVPSSIPLVIIDGINNRHEKVLNRPLFGVTNSEYDKYKFLIDQNGNIEVNGKILATDFILDSSISITDLVEIIIDQKTQIDILKDKFSKLENKIKWIK